MKTSNKILGTSVLTALASSICCIAPLIAFVAGTSGVASSFSWLEPLRPYLIGFAILILGFSWYRKLKPQKQSDCNCDLNSKPKFIQSKTLLVLVTIFAISMLSIPYFYTFFYHDSEKKSMVINSEKTQKAEFKINGMTCNSCTENINCEVNKLNGIARSGISFNTKSAVIEYDSLKTSVIEIENAIESTGYKVIKY